MKWQKIGCVIMLAIVALGLASMLSLSGCTADQTDRARDGVTVIRDGAQTIGDTIPGTSTYTAPIVAITTAALALLGWWKDFQEKRKLQKAIKSVDPIIDALPDIEKQKLASVQGPKVAAATRRAKLA